VRVARPLEVPVRTVVGEHQAVALHRAQDRPRPRAEPVEGEGRLEPKARAHRRTRRVVDAGLVASRPDVRVRRARDGEPDGVRDAAGLDLVPADEPGQDREPGGVGRRPGLGAEPVRVQVEHGTAPSARVAVVPRRGEQLVQPARASLDDQRVPIRTALDRRSRVERIGAGVALGGVGEPNMHLWVAPSHDVDRESVRGRPEVRMEVRRPRVGRTKPRVAQLVNRQRVDPRVPDVRCREDPATRSGDGFSEGVPGSDRRSDEQERGERHRGEVSVTSPHGHGIGTPPLRPYGRDREVRNQACPCIEVTSSAAGSSAHPPRSR
jgi:hypothetical protein